MSSVHMLLNLGHLMHHRWNELCEDILEKEILLEKLESRDEMGKLKGSLSNLHESANEDINALSKAEEELTQISKEIEDLEMGKSHYEKLLNEKLLPDIKLAEAKYQELEHKRKESYEKASYIFPESEVEALGGCKGSSPEQLSAQLTRMTQRLQRAREKCTESIDDLRMVYEKKQRKILKKQKTCENFCQQLQRRDLTGWWLMYLHKSIMTVVWLIMNHDIICTSVWKISPDHTIPYHQLSFSRGSAVPVLCMVNKTSLSLPLQSEEIDFVKSLFKREKMPTSRHFRRQGQLSEVVPNYIIRLLKLPGICSGSSFIRI